MNNDYNNYNQGGQGPQYNEPPVYPQQPQYPQYQQPPMDPNYGYQQYPGQYPQYPQQQKTNTLAILALVFAFIFAPAGLILGIVAKNQIKKTGENGKGLATAAIIISIIPIVLVVSLLILSVVFSTLVFGSIKDNISQSTYCSQAFSCVDNYDGTETCKYCVDEYCGDQEEVICEK